MLERADELAVLDECLSQCAAGTGRAVLVDGPAGIGKSRLLAETAERAARQGFHVLRARGSELEGAFPFGVVRQLFEPLFVRVEPAERAALLSGAASLCETLVAGTPEPGDARDGELGLRRLHGLYWLCANLSAEAPLLLTLDDLQWADASSLQFVAYLAARLDGLPLTLVAAARAEDTAGHAAVIDRLQPLRLRPLSMKAIDTLARHVLGRTPTATLVSRCHEATGGVPFLALSLLRAAGAEDDLTVVGLEEIARSIAHRLGRLPPSAAALCRAVAILGGRTELRHAATLAGSPLTTALADLDVLCAADILNPTVEFVHPIVHTAVYAHLPSAARDAGHLAAARLLDTEARPREEVAAHLMRVEPRADPWIATTLLDAAHDAGARGAPGAAVGLLRRALREPPRGTLDADIRLALGIAEVRVGDPAGVGRLASAVTDADDPKRCAAGISELVVALVIGNRMGEGIELIERATDAIAPRDREVALALESVIGAAAKHVEPRPSLVDRWDRYAPVLGDTIGERMLLGEIAWHRAMRGGPVQEIGDLAEQAIVDGAATILLDYGAQPQFFQATLLILTCDRYQQAERALVDSLAAGRALGSPAITQIAEHWLAELDLRRGRLHEAAAHATTACDLGASVGWESAHAASRAVLARALVERGMPVEAEAALALDTPAEALPTGVIWSLALEGRVVVRLSLGQIEEALTDLLVIRRRERGDRGENPSACPWRSQTALALHALGESGEAERLAREEVELARAFGAPRALGVALRAAGLVSDTIAPLEEAVAVLRRSGAELEHARALVDLGAAVRRSGRRTAAREPLRDGLERALACGATGLAARGHAELLATGARHDG